MRRNTENLNANHHLEMGQSELIEPLNRLVQEALARWEFSSDVTARLLNISENVTYIIDNPNANKPEMTKTILRVHRENYHTRNAIRSELAWLDALRDEGKVLPPHALPGRDGDLIQTHSTPPLAPRHLVLFEFIEGDKPEESKDLTAPFEALGELAALTHKHSIRWSRPIPFERLTWDLEAIFGDNPTWGDWRNGPKVDGWVREILEEVEKRVSERLTAFGQGAHRFGLIHADMRLANLLIDNNTTRLIDFDDCGLGWFLYDFATGVSFMEDHPQLPTLKEAWVRGYRKIRRLPVAEEKEIDTFVMLRRLALLAWMGSHSEVDIVVKLRHDFARISAALGRDYLRRMSQMTVS